jgi:hypothetical protein
LLNAWIKSKGSPSITIAILDTGIKEDDYCFKEKIVKKYNTLDGSENVSDVVGHGTWVSSICTGREDVKRNIFGICPKAKLIVIKVTDKNNECDPENLSKGIKYAADNGAKIINISLGTNKYSYNLKKSIQYAITKGSIVVSCSGNYNNDVLLYPSQFHGVISVGASNNNERAYFSNYGMGLKLLAPGMFIRGSNIDGTYFEKFGTSASTAIVSGIVALILSEHPHLTNQQVEKCLFYSANDICTGLYNYNLGRDIYSGYGIVNAANALSMAERIGANSNLNNDKVIFNGKWYSEAVSFFINIGLFKYNKFNPEKKIVKTELDSILKELTKIYSQKTLDIQYSLIKDKDFTASEELRRIDVVVIMLKKFGIQISDTNVYSNIFSDYNNVATNFKKYLTYAFQNGLVDGKSYALFCPDDRVTYAELCQLLYNMYIYNCLK